MEITYTLDPNDILHFQKYVASQKSFWQKIQRYGWSVFGIAIFSYSAITQYPSIIRSHADLPRYVLTTIAPLLVYISILVVSPMINKRAVRKPSGLLQPVTLRLTKSGLSMQSAVNTTEIDWTKLHDIAQDNTHCYFFLAKNRAYIVPKRAFESLERADEFYQTALAYRNLVVSGEGIGERGAIGLPPKLQRQLRYTTSHADIVHSQKYFQRRKWRFVKSWNFVRVLMGIGLSFWILRFTNNPLRGVYGPSQALGLLVSIVLTGYCVMLLIDAVKNAKNGRQRSDLQTLSIDLNQVTFSESGARVSIAWPDLKDITTDSCLLYFSTGRLVYIVPRDAFGSPEDADDFYEMVKTCWESAKSGTPLTELPQSQSWPPAPTVTGR